MSDLIIDRFTDREFSTEELTEAINVVPNMYQMVTQLGIFGDVIPLDTTTVAIDMQGFELNLLPFTERGGPGTKGSVGKRTRRVVEIPQITHEDSIKAADVQNLQRFGSRAPMMLEDKVNEKLTTLAGKHYLTHEWHKVQALQGKVLDADGSVVIDFYEFFDIEPKVVAFGGGLSINEHIRIVKRHVEDNLLGEVMTGVGCLASAGFMEMLFEDLEVKRAYDAAMAAHMMMVNSNPNLVDARTSFTHQGVTFVEYRGRAAAKNADGTTTTRHFIPNGDARFFPIGTVNTAKFYAAPGDFEETVNTPAQLLYAKEARDKWGREREFLTQSNPLPLWTRPALLVRGHTGTT